MKYRVGVNRFKKVQFGNLSKSTIANSKRNSIIRIYYFLHVTCSIFKKDFEKSEFLKMSHIFLLFSFSL